MRKGHYSQLLLKTAVVTFLLTLSSCQGQNSERRVVVFIIDSATNLATEQQQLFELFPKESHGGLVKEIVHSYVDSGNVHFLGVDDLVDNSTVKINRKKYLDALKVVADHVERYPNNKIVVNISLGSKYKDPEEEIRIRSLIEKGVIIVAAAGNDAVEQVRFPAAYDGVIAVGATDKSRKWAHSNYSKRIDISADGTYRKAAEKIIRDPKTLTKQGRTNYVSGELMVAGTSFSAPRVAGTAAKMLLLANGQKIDVKACLKQSATPMIDEYYRAGKLGAGLLNEHQSYRAVNPVYWWIEWPCWPLGLLVFFSVVCSPALGYGIISQGFFNDSRVKLPFFLTTIVAGLIIFFAVFSSIKDIPLTDDDRAKLQSIIFVSILLTIGGNLSAVAFSMLLVWFPLRCRVLRWVKDRSLTSLQRLGQEVLRGPGDSLVYENANQGLNRIIKEEAHRLLQAKSCGRNITGAPEALHQWAESKTGRDIVDKTADGLFKEANQLYEQGKFDAATQQLEFAESLYSLSESVTGLATCQSARRDILSTQVAMEYADKLLTDCKTPENEACVLQEVQAILVTETSEGNRAAAKNNVDSYLSKRGKKPLFSQCEPTPGKPTPEPPASLPEPPASAFDVLGFLGALFIILIVGVPLIVVVIAAILANVKRP